MITPDFQFYYKYSINICNKFRSALTCQSVVFKTCLVFGFVYFLLVITVINQFLTDPNLNWSFCFSNKCLAVVSNDFEYKLLIFKELTIFLALSLTAIGVRTGLQTYKLSLENSILSNHNSNLKIFIDFCNYEVVKYKLLDASKINYYELYNVFYPNSRKGEFYTFEKLLSTIFRLKNGIAESNVEYLEQEVNKSFKYKNHQSRTIKLVANFGFDIDFRSRVDFYEIESQIYEFIDSLVLNFSSGVECIRKVERKYARQKGQS